jgi:CheY-like chemotaxis protein
VSRLKAKIDILVVDDDVDMAETLSDILTAKGVQVEIAHNGYIAVEKTKAKIFDIVLMDIKMPTMNGGELQKDQTNSASNRRGDDDCLRCTRSYS